MISFRFHVVSITAVFLAIAIGIVVGSTYVDGAVVDGLRNRIATVSRNVDEREEENDRLEGQLETARAYIDTSREFAVSGRLDDVPLLLVGTRGIDERTVAEVAILARRAGAIVPGVVWLEPRWGLENEEERIDLAAILDAEADDAAEVLWSTAWEAIVAEIGVLDETLPDEAVGPTETTTTTTVPTTDTTIPEAVTPTLSALEAAGFVTVDPLDDDSSTLEDLRGSGARLLVLTGPRAQREVAPQVRLAVAAAVDAGVPTVVADVYVEAPEAPGRGDTLLEALDDAEQDAVTIVDDADQPEGQVAAVLAVDLTADTPGGHFGYGDSADGVLPPWTAP